MECKSEETSGDDPSSAGKEETSEIETVSSESIVEQSYSIVSHNTELLVLIVLGIIKTSLMATGFWFAMQPSDLFGPDELDWDAKDLIYQVSEFTELAGFYTVHVYLAAYILLPYPILTNKQSVVLTPWLMCGVLRSVILKLVESMAGVLLCSAHTSVHYPCLKFTIWHALEFSFSLYLWTSVHTFYHYLQRNKSCRNFERVLQSINIASMRNSIRHDTLDSLTSECHLDDDDGPETENVLFERAAMAWIWREILESGDDYITDSQFSQYLLIKATMELRQILSELAEKRKTQKRTLRKSMEEKIKDSLEFCRKIAKLEDEDGVDRGDQTSAKTGWQQAFDENRSMSIRDPLKRIPPLILGGKPFLEDGDSVDSEERTLLMSITEEERPSPSLTASTSTSSSAPDQPSPSLTPTTSTSSPAPDRPSPNPTPTTSTSNPAHDDVTQLSPLPPLPLPPMSSQGVCGRGRSIETDPLTPELESLFDVLEQRHAREQKKKTSKSSRSEEQQQ